MNKRTKKKLKLRGGFKWRGNPRIIAFLYTKALKELYPDELLRKMIYAPNPFLRWLNE